MYYAFLFAVFFIVCFITAWVQAIFTRSQENILGLENIMFGVCVVFLLYYFKIGVV